MLNGCEWLRCILAYLEWLLWDHTENESDLTCNNTTFQDVYLKKPPPPSTLYKVWATQQDSLQQRDQKKTTRCQRCLWLVSGSREFSRDSAFSRSWCPARSWGLRWTIVQHRGKQPRPGKLLRSTISRFYRMEVLTKPEVVTISNVTLSLFQTHREMKPNFDYFHAF